MKTLSPLVALLLSVCSSNADSIPGLFNTGLDAGGNPLADAGIDPHYSLVVVPLGSGLGPNTFAALSTQYPLSTGDWIPNSASSKWIAPQADQSTFDEANGVIGTYIYQMQFNLTGYNPATAIINGIWTTDNPGQDILINGVSTGITHLDGAQGSSFTFFTPFTISSGFVEGLNTLDFVVYDTPFTAGSPQSGSDNPSGLRVELSGTIEPVPEPSSVALLGFGLILLVGPCVRLRNLKSNPPPCS